MGAGVTQLADVIVPEIFSPYVQQQTEEKSRLIQSGAMVADPVLSGVLSGGGTMFSEPSFRDLDNDADKVSTDQSGTSSPNKIGTSLEVQVRLSRNNSWSSYDLTGDLAGADPMTAIADRVANYWTRRLQAAFVATMKGIFADNAKAPDGSPVYDTHTQNDMTHDISGSYTAGSTDFSAEAFIDACLTMGDSMEDLSLVMVHSIVYGRMQKNNLIDFIPDSEGRVTIPTFLGRRVVTDDGIPFSTGTFQTWLFGAGAVRFGAGQPKVPTEVDRAPAAGNGGGQTTLFNRVEWIIHPVGHAFRGAPAAGGPDNTDNSNMLAHEDSWKRVYPERKQIKIARLITTEF